MMPADWTILAGAPDARRNSKKTGGISYGVQLVAATLSKSNGQQSPLPRFQINSPDYSVQGWMSRQPWLGKGRNGDQSKLGLLELAQTELMDLAVGASIHAQYRIIPGLNASVASVADQLYQGPMLSGNVGIAGSSITAFNQADTPVNQVFSDHAGNFKLRLPSHLNTVRLVAQSPWGERLETVTEADESPRLRFVERGELQLPAGPVRLSFFNANDMSPLALYQDPRGFSRGSTPYLGARDRNDIALAGLADDPTSLWLTPGRYRVLASRGSEFSVTETTLTMRAGQNTLDIDAPQRQVNAGDLRSIDLHVHSAYSFDSTLAADDQYRRYLASGSDILVLSDHNRIGAPQLSPDPARLQIITGLEFTGTARTATVPMTSGHSNVFPWFTIVRPTKAALCV